MSIRDGTAKGEGTGGPISLLVRFLGNSISLGMVIVVESTKSSLHVA